MLGQKEILPQHVGIIFTKAKRSQVMEFIDLLLRFLGKPSSATSPNVLLRLFDP